MQIRRHVAEGCLSEASYSDCGAYRYLLTRHWDEESTHGTVNFIMLNPSVADEFRNDPTVERCERRARAMGFGGFSVTNIFAWRDTDPRALRRAARPIGPENDSVLCDTAQKARMIVAAWGAHGAHQNRGPQVREMLCNLNLQLNCLGLSKHGHPRHPLYISYEMQPKIWNFS